MFSCFNQKLWVCSFALGLSVGMSLLLARIHNSSTAINEKTRAVSVYNRYISLGPRTPVCKEKKDFRQYIERGHKYARMGHFQKAADNYSIGIRAFPQSHELYELRAQAYGDLGQYKEKISDLTSAIKVQSHDASLYEKRADTYYQLGDLENAICDSIQAIRLDPSLPGGYRTAAAAYEELGLYKNAIDFQTKLIGLKNDPLAWSNRARNFQLLGKFDAAQADRKKAIALASTKDRVNMQLCSPLIDFDESITLDRIVHQIKEKPVVMPFQYDPGGKICIPVEVNGNSLNLMVDSGCNHSDLWKTAISKVGAVQYRKNEKGEDCPSFFRARELRLGHLSLSNVALAVDSGLGDHKTLSGFLGGNILENFVVTIDYSKKQVILASSVKRNSTIRRIVVPMVMRSHRPFCSVTLDGKYNFVALLDTGTPYNLSADSLLKPVLQEKLIFSDFITGPWLGGVATGYVRLESLNVGALSLEHPIFSAFYAPGAPHAAASLILGNSFLSRFSAVTFDYPARQLILEPNERTSESALSLIDEGRYYSSHNQEKRAVRAFSKAITLDSELAENCYWLRALTFMKQKQFRQAVKDLDKLILLDPQNVQAYRYRAINHRNLEEYDLQIADYSTVIHLDPSNYSAYLERAWAYDKIGNHQLAARDQRAAERLMK